jgi:ABC-2 type transport system permease protein
MSAATTLPAPVPAPLPARVPAGAGQLTGTGVLLRAALRRNRRRLVTWVLALGGITVYAAVALGAVYPTAADRQARAAVMETPAGILLSGPGFGTDDYTLGAMIANELGLTVLVAVSIMSISLVVRQTRAEEESGNAELLLAAAVGRRAPLASALALMAIADVAVAVVITAGLAGAGLAGAGLAAVDAAALAVGFALTGAVFGAVAAVTAQLFVQARAASGSALAVLGAAVLVRGVGDVLHHSGSPLSWLSPIAWAQQTRAFVDLRWEPLGLSVALAAVLTALALRLSARRDVGAGLLTPRRGADAASGWLAGPAGLLARLQRGTVAGWTAALLLLGLTFGSLTDSVTDMIAGNPRLATVFGGEGAGLTDSFTAAAGLSYGLCAAACTVGSVLRLRGEESAGRLELLRAGGVDRRRVLGAGLAVACAAAVLLLLVAGLGGGLAAAAVSGRAGAVPDQLGTALVQLPAVLLLGALTAVLVAAVPRRAGLAWVAVCWVALLGMFGPLLQLPGWAARLSPFGWLPRVPAVDLDVAPLAVLLLVAAALGAVALLAFRRRDLSG